MTATIPMAAHARMAKLADLLPDETPGRRRPAWLVRLGRLIPHRRPAGLAYIPERYRLQFLLLASDALPGATPGEVAAAADWVADRVHIPGRLLAQLPDTTGLDAWFRGECDHFREYLGELLEAQTR